MSSTEEARIRFRNRAGGVLEAGVAGQPTRETQNLMRVPSCPL